MNEFDPDEKQTLLKKNVCLVHTSGTLSLVERKLFNVLLLQAFDSLKIRDDHIIPLRTLLGLMNTPTRDYALVRSALKALAQTTLQLDVLDRKGVGPKFSVAGLISFGGIEDGLVTYRYDRWMVEQLHNPEVFAQINLTAQRQFSSQFALNLHENASRFRDVRSTGWWDIDEFRTLMGATSKMYSAFPKLRERVIDAPVKEINRLSDLFLAVEYERGKGRGNPVVKIRFRVESNPQRPLFRIDALQKDLRDKPLYKALRDLGCSDSLSLNILGWGDEAAKDVHKSVLEGFMSDRIKKPAAYIAKLYQENARPGPPEAEKAKIERSEAIEREEQQAKQHADDATRRREFERNRTATLLASLGTEQIAAHQRAFLSDPSRASSVKRYLRDGAIEGLGRRLLESFIVQAELGSATEHEFAAWTARTKR